MDGRKGKQLATDGRFKGNWTKDGLSFFGRPRAPLLFLGARIWACSLQRLADRRPPGLASLETGARCCEDVMCTDTR